MLCKKCGFENIDGSKFCVKCGSDLVESQIEENNQKYVGTKQKILVEGESKNNPEMLTGRTDSNKVVIFKGPKCLINNIIEIEIESEHMWYLKGEVL